MISNIPIVDDYAALIFGRDLTLLGDYLDLAAFDNEAFFLGSELDRGVHLHDSH